MGRITRRLMVGGGAALALGAAAAGGSRVACTRAGRVAALRRLDVLLPHLVDARRIGSAYRAEHGIGACLAEAEARPALVEALTLSCDASRLDRLEAAIRADFAAGDIVICDRLVLSRTECIVAGLRYDRAERPMGRA